jgi:hypothetical protein
MMRIPKIGKEELLTAINWARGDAEDDFCPDYVRYEDYGLATDEHVPMLMTLCLRPDMHQLGRLVVPKPTSLLSRDTPWFPFPLRITYMLLARRLLSSLRACLSPSCHSSKMENWDGERYPWGSRLGISAFAQFENEYRRVVIDHASEGFAVATDVTAFYEHVAIGDFVAGLRSVLDESAGNPNNELIALEVLLQAAAYKGRGLPQNMDPSRFFADVYLRIIDDRIRAIGGLTYLRFVDDIRIVARTKGAIMRGLQQLEAQLKAVGLFLNSKKTELIAAGAVEWKAAQEADHDFRLARCDELLHAAAKGTVEECLQVAGRQMQAAASRNDYRRVKAYGNRVLRAAQFTGVREDACRQLEEMALLGFRNEPGAAETWARFASPALSAAGVQELTRILSVEEFNAYAWANMWGIITIARASSLPGEAMDMLRSIVNDASQPDYVRGWAAVAFARHADGLRRREVVDVSLQESNSVFLRRAAVVAAQGLPSATKNAVRTQTIHRDPTLSLLWQYLDGRATYDWHSFPSRDFAEAGPEAEEAPSFEAIGLVRGKPKRFKAYSLGTEYEAG